MRESELSQNPQMNPNLQPNIFDDRNQNYPEEFTENKTLTQQVTSQFEMRKQSQPVPLNVEEDELKQSPAIQHPEIEIIENYEAVDKEDKEEIVSDKPIVHEDEKQTENKSNSEEVEVLIQKKENEE